MCIAKREEDNGDMIMTIIIVTNVHADTLLLIPAHRHRDGGIKRIKRRAADHFCFLWGLCCFLSINMNGKAH